MRGPPPGSTPRHPRAPAPRNSIAIVPKLALAAVQIASALATYLSALFSSLMLPSVLVGDGAAGGAGAERSSRSLSHVPNATVDARASRRNIADERADRPDDRTVTAGGGSGFESP